MSTILKGIKFRPDFPKPTVAVYSVEGVARWLQVREIEL